MLHLELRKFPHSMWRFNLTEAEIRAIALPWVCEQRIDLGERSWSPHEAKITILEGPRLAADRLTMGRGWRTAQREGQDVTERVLASVRESIRSHGPPLARGPAPEVGGPGGTASAGTLGDPLALGVQLATLLGEDATALLDAWRTAAARHPELAPSESLARAEREIAAGAGEHG
jgi:hypothetical protein